MSLSVRQIRRLVKRGRRKGERAVIHGNRGRPSNRRIKFRMRSRICTLYTDSYKGFNLTHFKEMLEAREEIKAPCRETLRHILGETGLWERRRKAPKHRLRRPRREHEGEMLQVDASIHRWFGPEGPEVALVGCVDDATSDVPYAQFFPAETTAAYMIMLREVIARRGVPVEVYSDRDSVFVVNDPRERERITDRGGKPETQFGRALRELDIRWIAAYSPQAKGRVERGWGTHQDRLYNEMRLEGIKTMEEGNRYLHGHYLRRHNQHFRREAARPESAYRPAPPRAQLDSILCAKHSRTLALDHTFSFEGVHYQVLPSSGFHSLAKKKIEVRVTPRDELQSWCAGKRLRLKLAPAPLRLAREVLNETDRAESRYSRKARVRW